MRALNVTKVAALALTFAWVAGCSSTSTQTDSADMGGSLGSDSGAMTSGSAGMGGMSGASPGFRSDLVGLNRVELHVRDV